MKRKDTFKEQQGANSRSRDRQIMKANRKNRRNRKGTSHTSLQFTLGFIAMTSVLVLAALIVALQK